MPVFPGCEGLFENKATQEDIMKCSNKGLMNYLFSNLKYPNEAKEKGLQGTTIVQFVINTKGKVQDVKLIRDIGGGAGTEAIRVVESMNDNITWVPGKQGGKVVNVLYTLPIKFSFYSDDKKLEGKKSLGENIKLRANDKKRPLIVVNGKIFDGLDSQLKPDDIEEIFVLKGKSALEKYGEEGSDGVIEIKLKGKLEESDLRLNLDHFVIAPNPTHETFELSIGGGSKDDVLVEVYDESGRILHSENIDNYNGKVKKSIQSSQFTNRVAFVRVTQNGKFDVKKVVFN